MTGEGILFSTHEGNAMLGHSTSESGKPVTEYTRLGDVFVCCLAILVALTLGPARPKFNTEEHVVDAVTLQRAL